MVSYLILGERISTHKKKIDWERAFSKDVIWWKCKKFTTPFKIQTACDAAKCEPKGREAFKFDNQGTKKIYLNINEGDVNYTLILSIKGCKPTIHMHLIGDKKVFLGGK